MYRQKKNRKNNENKIIIIGFLILMIIWVIEIIHISEVEATAEKQAKESSTNIIEKIPEEEVIVEEKLPVVTIVKEAEMPITTIEKVEMTTVLEVVEIPEETIVNENEETNVSEEVEEPEEIETENVTDEIRLLQELVVAEAAGECYDGKVAVAATVLNIAEHDGLTITEVINYPYKFSSVWNGKCHLGQREVCDADITEEIISAVEAALAGEDPTEEVLGEGGALFFYNPKTISYNEALKRQYIRTKIAIGNHTFYRVWDTQ